MSGCGTHGGQLWYRHFPADFLDGVKALSAEERGCYITVLDLIYQFGGKVADRAQWIAGQCNVSVKRWNMVRRMLIGCGKLAAIDGNLTNPRATSEIAQSSSRSEARAEAGRKGGQKNRGFRAKPEKNTDVPNDNNGLAEAELSDEEPEIVSNDLTDYPPDNRPEDSPSFQENQSTSESRISRSSRVHISHPTESVLREDDCFVVQQQKSSNPPDSGSPISELRIQRPAVPPWQRGNRRHPANAPALSTADPRVTFDAQGRHPEVNGSMLEPVVRSITEAAEAPDGIYPIVNCTPLIDLLCEGYDPDLDICPVIRRIAARGHRGKHMGYYATAIRNEIKKPSWRRIGTWGPDAKVVPREEPRWAKEVTA